MDRTPAKAFQNGRRRQSSFLETPPEHSSMFVEYDEEFDIDQAATKKQKNDVATTPSQRRSSPAECKSTNDLAHASPSVIASTRRVRPLPPNCTLVKRNTSNNPPVRVNREEAHEKACCLKLAENVTQLALIQRRYEIQAKQHDYALEVKKLELETQVAKAKRLAEENSRLKHNVHCLKAQLDTNKAVFSEIPKHRVNPRKG